MLFNRSYSFNSNLSANEIRNRLLGQHLKVHGLDFEISEKEGMIKIIPHTEEDENNRVLTLPISHIEFRGNDRNTQIRFTAKPRKIDEGGPLIVVGFCIFMVLVATAFLTIGHREYREGAFLTMGVAALIFLFFWFRMEMGYFDYVRKIRDWVKKHSS